MKDIEAIKQQAKKGDVQSQVELAHAYLNGEGVAKNRAHYLTWLTKAAEQNNVDAQYELFQFYSNKRSKYTDMQAACYWAGRAKANGMAFTEEELLKVGDADSCEKKINEYLFGEKIQFEKAKSLILKSSLSKETLLSFAERYEEINISNNKRLNQIYYLYLQSTGGDAGVINSLAVNLAAKSKRNHQKIAAELFREAYQKGDKHATASYIYCLIHGKGVKKDVSAASRIYYEYKNQGIILSHAFASDKIEGIEIKLPTSLTWKMGKVMLQIDKGLESMIEGTSKPLGAVFSLPTQYWANQLTESVRAEEDAIAEELSKGNYAAADGCRDGGCSVYLVEILNSLMGIIGLLGIVAGVIFWGISGHIPTWLVCTVGICLFLPSFFGCEGKVTGALAWLSPVVILALVLLNIVDWDVSKLGNVYDIIKKMDLMTILGLIVLIGGAGLIIVQGWLMSNFFMGYWFQYVAAIEWKYGSFKAFIFVAISLAITLSVGYLLYQHGIIF